LFFAVQGERLDGHDFVEAALAAGAVAAVVARTQASRFRESNKLLLVEDPLLALQTLGTAVRKLWAASPAGPGEPGSALRSRRLIAITGSAGKTTTKEALATVLSVQFNVLKSQGNLNNHFGLPLQLLRLQCEHELAVLEMGMSHAGEIAALARIALPDMGVVTCVAPVHLGYFDSVAGIARAKYELIQGLPPSGTAVLNADDEYVSQFGRDFPGKVVTFAVHRPADVRAGNIHHHGPEGSTFQIVAGNSSVEARLPLLGEHNIYNALAAIAVALECGVPLESAAAALLFLSPPDKRGQVLQIGRATIINDCYNSNPKALDSMVSALASMPLSAGGGGICGRRIVVAGEMLELGNAAEELHRESGRSMAVRHMDILLGVRGAAREMVEAARDAGMDAEYVETSEQAGEWLAQHVRPGDVVLLKASRGVRLERALEVWTERAQAQEKGTSSSTT
jgi:UDP-N-acetylmuramoyl-tripeptide--D-alanyl-D-alanine ligase